MYSRRILFGLIATLGILWSLPHVSEAAIKAIVRITSIEFDGTTLSLNTSVAIVGQPTVGHDFTVTVANVPSVDNAIPGIKNQIIAYMLAQFGETLIDTEILIIGGLQ